MSFILTIAVVSQLRLLALSEQAPGFPPKLFPTQAACEKVAPEVVKDWSNIGKQVTVKCLPYDKQMKQLFPLKDEDRHMATDLKNQT